MPDPLAGLPPGFDPYKTLQVDSEADPEVIQAAYRRLAQKFHPDLAPGDEAAARMIAINAAWEILGDPKRRAALDRKRAAANRSAADGAAGRDGGRGASSASRTPAPGPRAEGSAGSGWGPEAPGPVGVAGAARPGPGPASPDRPSGRSTSGGRYDPDTMRAPDGHGAAGAPPGNPSGSVLNFGRYAGWSIGEIARVDVEYLEWLDRAPIGRAYRDEVDALLRRLGQRRDTRPDDQGSRRGFIRR